MISVVIPVYNEERNISPLYKRLEPVLRKVGGYEIIFVDDGSRDGTAKEITNICRKK